MHTPDLPFRWTPALLALLLTAVTAAADVWVITDSRYPVTGTRIPDRVIELDAAQRIEAKLSEQLPGDPQRAAMIIQQRLQQEGPALQQMHDAYQGLTDAWSLGITTIPAVVVDQRYVLYGESDLDKALARVEQHRREEKQP